MCALNTYGSTHNVWICRGQPLNHSALREDLVAIVSMCRLQHIEVYHISRCVKVDENRAGLLLEHVLEVSVGGLGVQPAGGSTSSSASTSACAYGNSSSSGRRNGHGRRHPFLAALCVAIRASARRIAEQPSNEVSR